MTRAFSSLTLTTLLYVGEVRADAEVPAYGAHAATERTMDLTTLDVTAAAQRAGTYGEPARALLDFGGVARAGFLGGELSVWGSAPNESHVYVDGTEIPALFHPTGLRTTVHPALLRRVSLVPGAAAAEYGRGLGAVVELTTRTLEQPGTHMTLRADAIDTSLSAEAQAGPVSALVALRYGYLDRIVSTIAPSSESVLAVPAHRDGVARVEGKLDQRTRVAASWIGARDSTTVRRGPVAGDAQHRTNGFDTWLVRLDRRYADGARVRLSPFVGLRDTGENSSFSGVPIALEEHAFHVGARADYTRSAGFLSVRAGLDARLERSRVTRSGTLTLPAREGDIRLFGQSPVDGVNGDQFHASIGNVAPHGTLTFRMGRWSVEPGVRLETLLTSTSRSTPKFPGAPAVGSNQAWLFVEPRLRVAAQHSAHLRSELRFGVFHQPPSAQDLSAVFGTPDLSPARAFVASASTSWELPADLRCELVGFAKRLENLTIRSSAQPPPLARALDAEGYGRAFGGVLSVRRDSAAGVFGALNYTLSHSVRSDPDGSWRRFDRDQPHVLSLLLGYATAHFSANLRARATSGSPYTRLIGVVLDSNTGTAQPVFGRHNGARSPGFFQLDVHVEQTFAWRALSGAVFFDVLNLSNQTNVEQVAYTADLRARRDVRGLPLLAMLGGRLGF